MDDVILIGNSRHLIQKLINQLQVHFIMKDLGLLHYFLGIEVDRTKDGMFLTQTKYILVLQRTNMLEAKPIASPVSTHDTLSTSKRDPLQDTTYYRNIVGALQYFTLTRPDMSFAVNQVCQFMHAPTESQLTAVKRILRLLKGTLEFGLHPHPGPL